ncbi:MAG: hypothetical protein IJT18_02610 [Oscillospiraceae bacterium]|nr:hypothetical protein [Oscillospiraceae bacterium]
MKAKLLRRVISVLLCLLTAFGTAFAAVLPDGYEEDFEQRGVTYQSLGVLEDQYDLIEPANNLFPVISPRSGIDEHLFFKGTYEQVENEFRSRGMTDGLPIIPPTKIKAEKFLGYSPYEFDSVVAVVDGNEVKAYQVAANAIMAGCAPEHLPVCIAFTEALSDPEYLDSLRSGELTPMLYVNGPVARQIGVDHTQGMTTEECNVGIARFMELALINLAGVERMGAFGNVQPLVFSEDDATCVKLGWKPHHVEAGYALNDSVVTASSFAMWGNNVTPATDLPEEIMKVIAWDVTEKNLGGLGAKSIEENAGTRRLIFITESVAAALATKYKSKDALENALIVNARRPLWMRAYAYYYANTVGSQISSFEAACRALRAAETEDAAVTASPAWMSGITYATIETVAAMRKHNTDIIVTGDSSRNKTQVIPGGVSVMREIRLSDRWDALVTSMNYNPLAHFYLTERDQTVTPPDAVPSALTDGTYRILDPATGETYLTRAGRVYYDAAAATLHCYAQGASASSTVTLDPDADGAFISYLENLGYNSSFTVRGGRITDVTIRFSSNDRKLQNNTLALTAQSFDGIGLTLHANNTQNSIAAGGLAKDGATVELSDTVTSFTADLDGTLVTGDTTSNGFVTLRGTTVTVDPTKESGATAVLGAANANGTYRTVTFVNGGDGAYTVTYRTADTLSLKESTVWLKGSFNGWQATDAFKKTAGSEVLSAVKELPAGTYTFSVHDAGKDVWYGKDETVIADEANRLTLTNAGGDCTLQATGGAYEFKFEPSTYKLSVYPAAQVTVRGDLDGDGSVSMRDVLLLRRSLAGGYGVTLDPSAADLNSDGNTDMRDLLYLRQYLAGGYGITL